MSNIIYTRDVGRDIVLDKCSKLRHTILDEDSLALEIYHVSYNFYFNIHDEWCNNSAIGLIGKIAYFMYDVNVRTSIGFAIFICEIGYYMIYTFYRDDQSTRNIYEEVELPIFMSIEQIINMTYRVKEQVITEFTSNRHRGAPIYD